MKEMIRELFQHRELFIAFSKRNITVRYKQTIMGFLWALFMPMVIILSGIMVKIAMSISSGKPFELMQIASVSVKALPWVFFAGAVKSSTNSLVGNMGLIKKIYFPREIFPLSSIFTQLFDFSIASLVLVIVFIFAKVNLSIHILWVPLLILLLIFFTAGLGMMFSCANLFFRDVRYLVDAVMTFGIFFTPVFFDARMFGKWKTVLLLNPVAVILENINSVVILRQAPDLLWLLYAALWAISGFFISWSLFHKLEPLFAEYI